MTNRFFFILCSFFLTLSAAARQSKDIVADLDQLITAGKYAEADKSLKERLPGLFTANKPDTLSFYPKYIGKIALKLRGEEKARQEVIAYVQKAKAQLGYQQQLIGVYFEAADFFSINGKNDLAYDLVLQADQHFAGKQKEIQDDLPRIQSNLGLYAMRMGKMGISAQHYRESIRLFETIANPNQERLYITLNSMGAVMWYGSKLDSSIYFFQKALTVLSKLEPTPLNKFYRVAIVGNNISGCYHALGKTSEAIQNYEQVLQNYRKFIASKESFPQKEAAVINQYQTVDNLAKIYIELGNFSRAHDLLFYSYQQKLNTFGEKSPEVYKSLVFLGTIYYNQREYLKSANVLLDALQKIRANGGTGTVWEADACAQIAVVYQRLKRNAEAAVYYDEADKIYNAMLGDQYNDVYLENLNSAALFYADNNEKEKAIGRAEKGLNYMIKAQGEQSLFTFRHLLNMADVNYRLGNYQQTLAYSKRGLDVINALVSGSDLLLDSIRIETEKPLAILLKTKATYKLLPAKDANTIAELLKELNGAMQIIEKRKTILGAEKDVNAMLASHKDLLDFIKQLTLDMYQLTNDQQYIDQIVGLHESGMYTRIRSRMDKQKALRFGKVPAEVQETELRLKEAITTALQTGRTHNEKIQGYIDAVNKWNDYQVTLKQKYPAYYNMRYAAGAKPLSEISASIPAGVSVVRYVYVGENIFALVAEQQKQRFIPLLANGIDSLIIAVNKPGTDAVTTGNAAHQLYKQLWQPLEKEISHKRVIIIPDGVLYNLSVEMLAPVPVKTYKELADNCLLSRYAISYHYSLLGLAPEQPAEKMKSNFVAFAPGFSDQAKQQYRVAVKGDSLHLDNTYLSLLPLPFTIDLAKQIQRQIGGNLFISNQSTPDAFRVQAGNHAIIHVGTHAESNNINPEFSRLIFSKDVSKVNVENSLYLFDIYDCDLSSQLAVLTACETGKPGYQDGEGMISLAHAFNYAGSQSILTGLWKIDEQVSAIITGFFYKNLQKGMTKDEALRQAKLSYLEQAEGRTLAPQYWAGLVIMGDITPVTLSANNNWMYWVGGGVLLLLLAGFFYGRNRKKKLPENHKN